MGEHVDIPTEGTNHFGNWKEGIQDEAGEPVPISHPNSRFTVKIDQLDNVDEALHDPKGVEISGILYGGRDADTNIPISESLSWNHGVFIGATIESVTTSATLEVSGIRKSNPMAIMDFVIVPLGKYLSNHIKFGKKLKKQPRIFSTNYFLQDEDGNYLNSKLDKKVWLLWAEGRIHGDFEAISTPIGNIPKFEDLYELFAESLHKKYALKDYLNQFSIRVDNYLAKFDRMEEIFKDEPNMPPEFWEIMRQQKRSLRTLAKEKGKWILSPVDLL